MLLKDSPDGPDVGGPPVGGPLVTGIKYLKQFNKSYAKI